MVFVFFMFWFKRDGNLDFWGGIFFMSLMRLIWELACSSFICFWISMRYRKIYGKDVICFVFYYVVSVCIVSRDFWLIFVFIKWIVG